MFNPMVFFLRLLDVPDKPPESPDDAAVLRVEQPAPAFFRLQISTWVVAEMGAVLIIAALFLTPDIPLIPSFAEKWLRFFMQPDYWQQVWEDPPDIIRTLLSWNPLPMIPNIGLLGYAVQALFSLAVILSKVQLRTHWYVIDERGVRTRKGLFTIQDRNADFSRIQSIGLKSSLLQGFFGLADIELNTASTSGSTDSKEETVLAFRNITNAHEIYDQLQARLLLEVARSGDPAPKETASPLMEAADLLLEETQALRRTVRVVS